jgi:pimeloyl-ACP methyl ester carboxylesterase
VPRVAVVRSLRLVLVGALAAAAALAAPSTAAAPASACTGSPSKVLSTSKLLGLAGRYTLPAKAPSALVVFAHGYRSWSGAWEKAMVEASSKHNAIAVAVDYRGLKPATEYHGGWPAAAGSEDVAKVASTFTRLCHGLATTAVFSVGMGGDVAGLAMAHHPSAFTYWVDVEGATDLYDLWSSLSAVGGPCLPSGQCLPGANTYFAVVRSDLETAAGGPPYEAKAGFDAMDAMTQLRSVSGLGLRGAAVVHAAADGTVLVTEAAAMTALLHELAVPTDLYAVGRGNGGPDQTLSGDVGVDLPLAGHEPDGATGDLVIRTGLSALWGMVDKGGTKPSGRVVPVDG